jgi:methyl-accepting chemotaxis protein
MPPLGQRQVYGILILLIGLLAVLAIHPATGPFAIGLAVLGIVVVVWSGGGGAGGISLNGLRDAVERARSGRKADPPAGASADIIAVYEGLSRIADAVHDLEAGSDEQNRELEQGIGQVSEALRRITDSVSNQMQLSETAARSIKDVTTSLREIAQHVEMLAASAEESSSSILEMTATNDEMAEHIGELSQSVRESVSSIEEMTYSIKEVAKNVDALSLTAEETSSSMNEMDVSIDQVQSNANETARLSEEVARDAEHGAESILKTIGEIYRIKESSQEAVAVISNLGSRIDAIGQILNVIDEVAEQTNLLALNAAIIAAQAGEHGKGFAVVADEIKDLAERAGAST